ncbi:MAG: hypothetical protein ACI4HI_13035 [Lachnospiraceae bacterium]
MAELKRKLWITKRMHMVAEFVSAFCVGLFFIFFIGYACGMLSELVFILGIAVAAVIGYAAFDLESATESNAKVLRRKIQQKEILRRNLQTDKIVLFPVQKKNGSVVS